MPTPMQRVAVALEDAEQLQPVTDTLARWFNRAVKPGPVKDLLAGTWFGHAMHPPLTAATIGSWASAALLDAFGGERSERAADRLVGFGILFAVPTALTGWNEMADSDGKAQRLATAHGLGNATVLGLFVLSWVSRKVGLRSFGRFLATVGMGLGSLTAHLGGHLSFIRGIGVNQTAFEKPRNRWTAVLDEAALPEGKPTRANADGVDLVLYRRGERMYALSGRCSHRGGPLYRGTVDESRACPSIVCPWHSSIFCLEDGSILQGPASAEQPSFEVRIADGKVEVRPRAS